MKEWARDNRIFSRDVDVLAHTPNPRCDTHKESCHPHVTETWALTKSLRSPSRRGGAQATYTLLRALTILGKLRKKYLDHQDRLAAANHQE